MLNNIFRLNPIFSITPVEDLTEEQRRNFRRTLSGKGIYSLLHAPREADFTVKALNRPLSEFLENLIEPGTIAGLLEELGEESDREVRQLIVRFLLDGVLEIRAEGGFISGIEAFNAVMSPSETAAVPAVGGDRHDLHRLSAAALDFAMRSTYTHSRDIAWILYNFNRMPMNRRRRRELPDETAVLDFLGLDAEGCWPAMPDAIRPVPPERDDEGNLTPFFQVWRSWMIGPRRGGRNKLGYKVYVSALPEETPASFRIVRDRALDAGASSMKTGRVASAMLRCDKLIVYFKSIGPAMEFGREIVRETSSLRGQGVPFTYPVSPESRLVSIGVDPPGKFSIMNSWRRYVTDKLAVAIQGAHREDADDPSAYIRMNMRLFGIDMDEWRPVSRDWTMEFDLDRT